MTSDVTELGDLTGWELSGIAFVRDYVELQFDGPILRSLARPVVVLDGVRHEFPRAGSRDALCALIGRSVESAEERRDRLVVVFSGGAAVEIPRQSDDSGPEIAHLVPTVDGKRHVVAMMVWENLRSSRAESPDRER